LGLTGGNVTATLPTASSTLLQQVAAGAPFSTLTALGAAAPDAQEAQRQQSGTLQLNKILGSYSPAAGSSQMGALDATDVSFLQQVLTPLGGGGVAGTANLGGVAAAGIGGLSAGGTSSPFAKLLADPSLDGEGKAFASRILLAGSDSSPSGGINAFGQIAGSSGLGASAEDQAYINNILAGTGFGQKDVVTPADQAWINGILPPQKYTLQQIQERAQQAEAQRNGGAAATPAATTGAQQPTTGAVANTYAQNAGTRTAAPASAGGMVNVATRPGEYVPNVTIRRVNGQLVRQ
jgi:hypothetical protein